MVTALASARVIGDYLSALRARKCSTTTLRTAKSVLHGLAARAPRPILELDTDDLQAWQERRAAVLNTGTLRTQASYIINFYRWALRHDLITEDPTRLMQLPRAPRRRPRPMRDEHIQTALDAADDLMRAVLCLAALAGLRACEVARLDWTEVWLGENPQLRVVGKGGHEDTVDISPQLAEVLRALPGSHRRGPVIPRLDGMPGHNTATRISQMANRHLRACGITDTYHALRHRFVTAVYQYRKDLRAAQEAARHASPTTTAGYAAIAKQDVTAAIFSAGDIRPAS